MTLSYGYQDQPNDDYYCNDQEVHFSDVLLLCSMIFVLLTNLIALYYNAVKFASIKANSKKNDGRLNLLYWAAGESNLTSDDIFYLSGIITNLTKLPAESRTSILKQLFYQTNPTELTSGLIINADGTHGNTIQISIPNVKINRDKPARSCGNIH